MPYDPVCGVNDVLYYSPCHAGCSSVKVEEGAKVSCTIFSEQFLFVYGI